MIINSIAVVTAILLPVFFYVWFSSDVEMKVLRNHGYPTFKAYVIEWSKSIGVAIVILSLIDFAGYGWKLIFAYLFWEGK